MTAIRLSAVLSFSIGLGLTSAMALAQQAAPSAKDAAQAAGKPAPKTKERRKCRRDTSSANGIMGTVTCETEPERQAKGQAADSKLERSDAQEYLRQQQMMGEFRPK